MKKNNMLRIASVLLVAVLLSTCAISGAFAKYTTEKSYTDSARVAKFGINVDIAENGGLFTDTVVVDGNKIVYSATSDVVAPGMEGELTDVLTITDSGREVAIKASVDANLDLGNAWLVGGAFYCPIVIKVGEETVSGLDYTDAGEFEADVEALIAVAERTYYVGEADGEGNPVLFAKTIPSVSWSWAFTPASGSQQTDEKDTALGIKGTDPISLTITVDVEQVNE